MVIERHMHRTRNYLTEERHFGIIDLKKSRSEYTAINSIFCNRVLIVFFSNYRVKAHIFQHSFL